MPEIRSSFLGQCVRLAFALSLAVVLVTASGLAQNRPQVSLETSETLFTVLTAINTCGYDQELNSSDPLRAQIRSEVAKAVENTAGAQDVIAPMCGFYRQRQAVDASRDLSQYLSLALYLDEPPAFTPKVKQAELPPDAGGVADMVPLMQAFYQKIGLHAIWERHRVRYGELTEIYHAPLAKMTFATEIYLKMPSSGYLGRQFTVYLDAMGAPGQTNARNYASDYYVVIAPSSGTAIKMQQIRHTYLHYLLDPLAMKNGSSFKRLEPLLDDVKMAPMDEAFKSNISLLVTECLVRAIEERLTRIPETERAQGIDEADKEGYVLTRYFYDALVKKEEDSGHALCILAEVATANRDMDGARKYFEQALQTAHDPKVIAWSHIYLGRIFDLKEDRFAALDQYRAALSTAGATLSEAKKAAQKGLEQPYEPPVARQPE